MLRTREGMKMNLDAIFSYVSFSLVFTIFRSFPVWWTQECQVLRDAQLKVGSSNACSVFSARGNGVLPISSVQNNKDADLAPIGPVGHTKKLEFPLKGTNFTFVCPSDYPDLSEQRLARENPGQY